MDHTFLAPLSEITGASSTDAQALIGGPRARACHQPSESAFLYGLVVNLELVLSVFNSLLAFLYLGLVLLCFNALVVTHRAHAPLVVLVSFRQSCILGRPRHGLIAESEARSSVVPML